MMTERTGCRTLDYTTSTANESLWRLIALSTVCNLAVAPLALATAVRAAHAVQLSDGISLAVGAVVAAASIVLASARWVRTDYPEIALALSVVALATVVLA